MEKKYRNEKMRKLEYQVRNIYYLENEVLKEKKKRENRGI